MNTHPLIIFLCSILVVQTSYSNNGSENNDSWDFNFYSFGGKCAGALCKLPKDYYEGQAAIKERDILRIENRDLQAKLDGANQTISDFASNQQTLTAESLAIERKRVEATEKMSKSVEKAGQVVMMAGAVIVAGGAAYKIGDTIYHHYNPTEEQKLHKKLVNSELRKFRAQQAARECIARHRKGAKDTDNIPYPCREKFDEFVAVANAQEIEEIKKIVNV